MSERVENAEATGGMAPESGLPGKTDPDTVSAATIPELVEAAFDYRGDVTLTLAMGPKLVGYVCNREASAAEPHLTLLPADGAGPVRVAYAEIRDVAFTGRDTASGKSWEAWVRKYEEKKAARRRGEKVESVGLFPEPLD